MTTAIRRAPATAEMPADSLRRRLSRLNRNPGPARLVHTPPVEPLDQRRQLRRRRRITPSSIFGQRNSPSSSRFA